MELATIGVVVDVDLDFPEHAEDHLAYYSFGEGYSAWEDLTEPPRGINVREDLDESCNTPHPLVQQVCELQHSVKLQLECDPGPRARTCVHQQNAVSEGE